MTKLDWSELSPLDSSVTDNIDSKPGVFRLSYKAADGSYYVFFVGRADVSLNEDLAKLTRKETDNPCIKTYLDNLECYFKCAFIGDIETRKDVERTLYENFKPGCNFNVPEGKVIEINKD